MFRGADSPQTLAIRSLALVKIRGNSSNQYNFRIPTQKCILNECVNLRVGNAGNIGRYSTSDPVSPKKRESIMHLCMLFAFVKLGREGALQ